MCGCIHVGAVLQRVPEFGCGGVHAAVQCCSTMRSCYCMHTSKATQSTLHSEPRCRGQCHGDNVSYSIGAQNGGCIGGHCPEEPLSFLLPKHTMTGHAQQPASWSCQPCSQPSSSQHSPKPHGVQALLRNAVLYDVQPCAPASHLQSR